MPPQKKVSGKLKWFNDLKGYGFITAQESGQDIFVHFSEINKETFQTMNEGEAVEFEITQGTRGLQAINVSKL